MILFLPLLLSGRVAEIVVNGEEGSVRLTASDFERLLPDVNELDQTNVSKLVLYGKKLLAAREAGLDTMLIFDSTLDDELKNDIIVSEWMEQSIAKLVELKDFENYFRENKERYRWEQPRFKGIIVVGLDNNTVKEAVEELQSEELKELSDIRKEIMSQWGKAVNVVSVIAEEGRNPYVDYAAFGCEPDFESEKWKTASVLYGRVIDGPESWEDVKDEVVHDCRVQAIEEIEKQLNDRFEYEIIEY